MIANTLNQNDLVRELDSYYNKISDDEQREKMKGDYYAFRGLICTACGDPYSAYENYEKAALHGYDEFGINLICYWHQSNVRRGSRTRNKPADFFYNIIA